MKAYDKDTGEMLCPDILSYDSYHATIRAMGADIASANYQQEPIDIKGRLYTSFKTYTELPPFFEGIYSYSDTADDGSDWLCSIIWGVYQREAYVLDVYFTQAPMEVWSWFHQSAHKNARIITYSTWVMQHIYVPVNWRDRFPEYYDAMISYQREGKNAHDDAPDATTGVAETMQMLGG